MPQAMMPGATVGSCCDSDDRHSSGRHFQCRQTVRPPVPITAIHVRMIVTCEFNLAAARVGTIFSNDLKRDIAKVVGAFELVNATVSRRGCRRIAWHYQRGLWYK
jgi:hypothetical protein